MDTKKQLTEEELKKIQEMSGEFNKAKLGLGDLELQKQGLLKHIELIRGDFSSYEMMLIEKYGKDSVINIQTGEITNKID